MVQTAKNFLTFGLIAIFLSSQVFLESDEEGYDDQEFY